MLATYPKQTRHEVTYYAAALSVILAGLVADRPQAAIVRTLADAGIRAPTGGEFTVDVLKGTLKQIRASRGHFYDAMLRLVFHQEMSTADARRLIRRQAAPAFVARTA